MSKYFLVNGADIGDGSIDDVIFRVYVNESMDEIDRVMLDPDNRQAIGEFGVDYWGDEVQDHAKELLSELSDEIKFKEDNEDE